jgi:UDP-hydrolysing UDP-N-acetyl-D-glucosamine 2-epimerase
VTDASPPLRIAVLTTGRQDWGILHSTAAAIRAHPRLELLLIAGGMHLAARYGRTVDEIEADGFTPDVRLEWIGEAGDGGAAGETAAALQAVGAALRSSRPDALLVAGDRSETAAAALAATLELVPIIHLHGGEQTFGAFDDALRHAITKLSHLHLVSHEEHALRLLALGEDPATVHVVGAPGLDGAFRGDLPSRTDLESDLGIPLTPPIVLVTVHPGTLESDPIAAAAAVAAAMDAVPATYVVTLPNADPGGDAVRDILLAATASRPQRVAVSALGERRYWGLLAIADAMLGNSSSALIEAPAMDLPAVDVGDRQAGRRAAANVVHAPADPDRVAAALRDALDPATRDRVRAAHPELADGQAGQRIADIIAAWRPPRPPRKPPIVVPDPSPRG